MSEAEIEDWLVTIERRLDDQIAYAKKHERVNEWCALLDIRGYSALVRHMDKGIVSATTAFAHWRKLAKLVNRAPLFPLERFADRLAQQAGFLGTHPQYESLTTKIDALLAKRLGEAKAAEKCLERARAFRRVGDLPRAMAQLHKAKIDWFAEETLGKAILAMLWLSRAYKEQGLFFAAKYYALAAGYVAVHNRELELKPFIACSLLDAAECDYAQGAWQAFLDLANTSAIFYPHYAPDPVADFNDPHSALQHLITYLTLVCPVTSRLHPALESIACVQCAYVAERLGFAEVLTGLQATLEREWRGLSVEKIWESVEEQLAGVPWSDAGPIRRTQWRAHGVTWNVEWANDYETTLAAEAFLSALQVVLSDMAGQDLCLMRATLSIAIQLTAEDADESTSSGAGYKGFDIAFKPSNEERRAIITLPPYSHFRDGVLSRDDLTIGAVGIVNSLLLDVSLLPTAQFNRILHARFAHGLPNKLLVGAPYGQCMGEFVSRETYDQAAREEREPPPNAESFVSRRPEGVRWVDGPGPGYDPDHVPQQMRNRYEKSSRPISRTLRRLAQEPEFRATLARLRTDGWKDWHILSVVFHATMNYRLNRYPYNRMMPGEAELVSNKLITQLESASDEPVPLEEYAEENLKWQMQIYLGAFAKTFGLELHQETPDFAALDDFLRQRYNFWTDDVEHVDPFAE